MAEYKSLRATQISWPQAISATPRKPYRFDIVAASGDEVRIRNSDGTTTLIEGKDLATTLRAGTAKPSASSLTGGRITGMSRLSENGELLERLSGLNVLAGGPSTQVSFTRPPGEQSSLAWVMGGISGIATPAAVDSGSSRTATSAPAVSAARPQLPSVETLDISGARSGTKTTAPRRSLMGPLLTIGGSIAVGFLFVFFVFRPADTTEIDRLKARFARPSSIPSPGDNIPTPARIELGKKLFSDTRLSGNGKVSCSTCHDTEGAFADGLRLSVGVSGKPLKRHTPTLWNLAWSKAFFWDGRSPSLEEQALKPLEDPDEMGLPLEEALARLRADRNYVAAFSAAYPDAPAINGDLLGKALASYQRSLVAPPTRFDRWVAGDRKALSNAEVAGFTVFTGKAKCSACHSGWAFTDHGFHDIGMPVTDKGRGAIMNISRLDHAFKTPSLREVRWTGPYMHDGSMATMEAVITHYEKGVIPRPSLSRDLPQRVDLTEEERSQLLAFIATLSSEAIPKPVVNIEIARSRNARPGSPGSQLKTVGQKDLRFSPENVRLVTGETLVIVNNDSRPHNVSIAHPRMGFSSGMQEPGEQVSVPFPEIGSYDLFCGVHPNMRLRVDVISPEQGK